MPADPKEYTYLWKDRIVSHPAILGGKPIIKGTRLSVEFVTDRVCSIHTNVDAFLEEYTQVSGDDVRACLEYAATGARLSNVNRAEMDQRVSEEENQRKKEWLIEWQNKNATAG